MRELFFSITQFKITDMRKFLIALIILMVSLASRAQFIDASVKKNADPTKIDIVFKPTYTSIAGEYISGLQFAVAIPFSSSGGGTVTATAVGVNTFTNMGALTASPLSGVGSTVGSEQIYAFIFGNPSAATQSWTAGVEFVG